MGRVVQLPRAAAWCPGCHQFGVPGWLPVTVKAGAAGNPYDYDLTTWRPCQQCRPEQHEAWRTGTAPAKTAKEPR